MLARMSMKKMKIFTESDFAATVSTIVEDCMWTVSSVAATTVGEHSGLPLFKLHLRKVEKAEEVNGFVDASAELDRTRTYFVREGRPMYDDLSTLWSCVPDKGAFAQAAQDLFWAKSSSGELVQKAYKGHVLRLAGVEYEKPSRDGKSMIRKSSLELWYPRGYEESAIMQDFLHMCNKGAYVPIINPTPAAPKIDLSKVDPQIIAAVMAAMGKK